MKNTDTMRAYGLWQVTTEGDEECRTTADLGIYEGNLCDIAFALADKALYALRFSRASGPAPKPGRKLGTVHVSIDGIPGDKQLETVRAMAGESEEDIRAEKSRFHCAVRLTRYIDPVQEKREAALAKLTDEEKELLGLAE